MAAIPGIERILDADHIVKGDGIAWMREYLGEDATAPMRHPALSSGFGLRVMGIRIPDGGGRIRHHHRLHGMPAGLQLLHDVGVLRRQGEDPEPLLHRARNCSRLMEEAETSRHVQSFFIMDENFLLQKKRAMELLACMKAAGKSWSLHIFSSANAIRKYAYEELVELGISSIWLGLESPRSGYAKLDGADTQQMSRELRGHGIVLLGSTIIGLEHHTPENIAEEIEFAVAHETDLHQFMLYTPVPGTPLYAEMAEQGRLLDVDLADIHGQNAFNFRHAAITREESSKFLNWAFRRDFERNGPSLFRVCRTTFAGWKQHKDHPDPRVRERFAREGRLLRHAYPAILWAIERRIRRDNAAVALEVRALRLELEREFGMSAIAASRLAGPILWWTSLREEKRLAAGRSYEPETIIGRRNWEKAKEKERIEHAPASVPAY